jgi:hypothetical protein
MEFRFSEPLSPGDRFEILDQVRVSLLSQSPNLAGWHTRVELLTAVANSRWLHGDTEILAVPQGTTLRTYEGVVQKVTNLPYRLVLVAAVS